MGDFGFSQFLSSPNCCQSIMLTTAPNPPLLSSWCTHERSIIRCHQFCLQTGLLQRSAGLCWDVRRVLDVEFGRCGWSPKLQGAIPTPCSGNSSFPHASHEEADLSGDIRGDAERSVSSTYTGLGCWRKDLTALLHHPVSFLILSLLAVFLS